MKRTVCAVIFCCFLALPLCAQRGGGGGRGAGGGRGMGGGMMGGRGMGGGMMGGRGMGGGMMGGRGMGGGMMGGRGMGGAIRGGGFGRAGAGFRGGVIGRGGFNRGFHRGFVGNRFFFRNGFFGNRTFFGTAFFPGFYGGFYDPFFNDYPAYPAPAYGYGYPDYGPDVTVISGNPYIEPPRIVINEGYRPEQPAPVVREYPPPPNRPESQSYQQPLYLIAFKDGVIRAVLAYWTEDGTLHYVTMNGEVKREPISSVDRELSERLNHERHVGFSLPR